MTQRIAFYGFTILKFFIPRYFHSKTKLIPLLLIEDEKNRKTVVITNLIFFSKPLEIHYYVHILNTRYNCTRKSIDI